ncbi:MAG: AAA family ATPase, partial [Lachnospiraceae bacterium]|nr:AAA family ATPase [Lachnospiraceae bacterium]
MKGDIQKLQHEVAKVIKGKDEVILKVIMAILGSGHILLEDVPGLG